LTAWLAELAARREALIAEAARQRAAAAVATAGIRHGLRFAERALWLVRYVGRKPLVAAVVAGCVAALIRRPGRALRWLDYGLSAYSLVRRITSVLRRRTD